MAVDGCLAMGIRPRQDHTLEAANKQATTPVTII